MKDKKNIIIIILSVLCIILLGTTIYFIINDSKCTWQCSCEEQKEELEYEKTKEEIELFYSSSYASNNIEAAEYINILNNEEEYKEFLEEYQEDEDVYETEYTESNLDFEKYNYVILKFLTDCTVNPEYLGHEFNGNKLILHIAENNQCGLCAITYTYVALGFEKEVEITDVDLEITSNKTECDSDVAYKPILYLYPEEDINLNVTFTNPENLTTTYPKYNNGWNVKVTKDGTIYDQNNKSYYALYWESNYEYKTDFKEGFYVTKDNAIEFLEEKLTILGLNDKERNEFIMFWLPIIEDNGQSLIYFETTDSLNIHEPINFSIEPDSLIRIRMHIKKVDSYTEIKEQKLTTPTRTGFTAVEWGGVIYK